jgi:hypothetical protein
MLTKNDIIQGTGLLGRNDIIPGASNSTGVPPNQKENSNEELTYLSL